MRPFTLVATWLLWAFAGWSQTLTPAQAREHDGEKVTVCGTVTNEHVAKESKGQPTFLDMDASFPNQIFRVLVWGEDRPNVGPLPTLNTHLCATGVISYFRGIPQIVVRNSGQISH